MSAASDGMATDPQGGAVTGPAPQAIRSLGWAIIGLTFAYFINNYLTLWLKWPGALAVFNGAEDVALGYVQIVLYILAAALPCAYSFISERTLRQDSTRMADIANYIIKVAFWSVVLIGIVDATISFLRVENLLPILVGDDLTKDIGRSAFRGPYIHLPLIGLAILISLRAKTLGFQWLALLVVVAELVIVLSRFVFSYEQAFQGDLVRFWYGALFLFASAYTLFEDGHVRVDVLYTGFSIRKKGGINAFGCLFLGISLCWVILIYGMWDKSSIINSALLTFEVSQSGFGMYVKYWMAGFLAVFALSMTVQFASYLLESMADYWGDPGHRTPPPSAH